MNKKPVIGITGGIGSGKSSVAAEFAKLGCCLIDADKMAKNLLNKPEIMSQIVNIMGHDVLHIDGKINVVKVAAKAFSDRIILEKLNSIIHPPVLEQIEMLLNQYLANQAVPAIVLDVPLLMEVGWDKRCDVLVFVDSELQIRKMRIQKNDRFDPEEIKKREFFQISLEKKKRSAQYIVKNNSDLSDLADQVARIYEAVIKV